MIGTSKWKGYLGIIGISVVSSSAMTYFTCAGCRHNYVNYLLVSFFIACLWISLWIGNNSLGDYLGRKISWMEFPIRRLVVGIVVTVLYTVSVVVIIKWLWEYFLDFNLGNGPEIIYSSLIVTFLISLFIHGREFLIRWKAAAIDAERLQKESVKAQYESLKNQVNPHFLFNSLNALTHLVYEDQDKAAKFIKQLSEVYRYVLDSREKEVVPLLDELKFLDAYLFLQQIRFGDKLKVHVNLSQVKSVVAPLALQMLIENAIKHNVISEEDPLEIRVYDKERFLIVENKIRRKTVLEDGSPGLGLENIRRRYEFLTKEPVTFSDKDGVFVVCLPIMEMPS